MVATQLRYGTRIHIHVFTDLPNTYDDGFGSDQRGKAWISAMYKMCNVRVGVSEPTKYMQHLYATDTIIYSKMLTHSVTQHIFT